MLDQAALSAALGLEVRRIGDDEYLVDSDASRVAALTAWLAEHDEPVNDIRAGQQRLEDVFLRLTGNAEEPRP